MSDVTHSQTIFNGGEISPFMLGRFDHDVWGISLLEMVGWVPRPQGPAEACPGTQWMNEAPGPFILIPFEPYVTQGYQIEASAELFRFYTNNALLTDGSGTVKVVHSYSYAQLLDLDWYASQDVLYLFHGSVKPQMLVRDDAAAFHLDDYVMLNGPFEDRNENRSLTVSANATTGSVTLTASAALFEAGDVGGLFEMEFNDFSAVKMWEPGITVSVGQLLQWGANVYEVTASSGSPVRTGTAAPTHVDGARWDGSGGEDVNAKGPYGVQLTYRFNAFGQLLITAYTSPTQVTATVQKTLAATSAVWRWRFGAFSDRRGWPEHGTIFNERMVLTKGDTRYLSQVGLLDDFSRTNEFGDVGDDQAIVSPMNNPNQIEWVLASSHLFTGSATDETALHPASAARGLAPGNTRSTIYSSRGSSGVRPIDRDGRPIFVQRSGRKIMMLTDADYERFRPEDLTRYADHIGNSRITCLSWQREPLQLLWGVREDGLLFGAIMMPEESVLGFFRRPLGGGMAARWISTITSPDGLRDDLWIAAQRGSRWFVLKLANFREAGQADPNAIMCDAALTHDGSPITTLNLPHLNVGDVVDVVGDGAWKGSFTLGSSRQVVLEDPVSKAMAGLPFSAYIRTLPIEAGGDDGAAQFKSGKITRLWMRLQQSIGLRVTVDGMATSDIESQYGNSDMDEALPFETRDVAADMVGTPNRVNDVLIERLAPKQATLLAISARIRKGQK